MRINYLREEDLRQVLEIYYENSVEILGIEDIEEMLKYDRRLYGEQYKFLNIRNLTSWYRRTGGKRIIGVYEDGLLIGFAVFHPPHDGIGYVEEIHVRREWRGRGVGSLLLTTVEEVLRKKGASVVYLEAQIGAVGFFEAKGYIPVRVEKDLYMGRLQYIDMVKVFGKDLVQVFRRAIDTFWDGRYREALMLLDEIDALIPDNVKGDVLPTWRLLAWVHKEDEETQSYLPLVSELISEAPDSVFRSIFDGVVSRILVEGLISAGLYEVVISKCGSVLEKLGKLRIDARRRRLHMVYTLRKLMEYLDALIHWCVSAIMEAKAVLRNYEKWVREAISSASCFSGHWAPEEFISEVRDMLGRLASRAAGVHVSCSRLSGVVKLINYGIIEGDPTKAGELSPALGTLTGLAPRACEGVELSEDVIPAHLSHLIQDARTYLIDHVTVKSPIDDFAITGQLRLTFYPSVPAVVEAEYTFSLEGAPSSTVYRVSTLGSSSTLEYDVCLGNYCISATDLEDVHGNISSLWFSIGRLFRDAGLTVKIENEPLNYAIIEIDEPDEPESILNDSYIRATLGGFQTVYRSPIENAVRIEGFRNLYSLIGFDNDHLYVSGMSALVIRTTMPLWISKETLGLLRVLLFQRALLHFDHYRLWELVRRLSAEIPREEGTVVLIDRIRKLHSSLAVHLAFVTSPTPFRYKEYIELAQEMMIGLGIRQLYEVIMSRFEEAMSSSRLLLTSMQAREINTLSRFLIEQERSRSLIEYVALIITVLGTGDIIWRVLSSVASPRPILQVPIYLGLTLTGLGIITYHRMKRKSI